MAEYWEQVVKLNDYQQNRIVHRLMSSQFNTIADKKIAILGFAFKADTGDTRESPAINIVQQLAEEKAHIFVTDPKAIPNAKLELKGVENVSYTEDVYKAVEGAHAVLLMTEWQQYKNLDFKKIYSLMEKPSTFFDTRNILDHKELFEIGFNVYPVGKKPLTH